MELTSLKELYIEELKDLYSAENQIIKALPKMIDTATEPELKQSFELHLEQTREHASRLERIFEGLGVTANGKVCKGMKGVLAEGAEMIAEDAAPDVRDAGLISAAQRVEHYEMAGYGSVRTYAEQLGEEEAVRLLEQTLKEEKQTDKKLSQLAESVINLKAAVAA